MLKEQRVKCWAVGFFKCLLYFPSLLCCTNRLCFTNLFFFMNNHHHCWFKLLSFAVNCTFIRSETMEKEEMVHKDFSSGINMVVRFQVEMQVSVRPALVISRSCPISLSHLHRGGINAIFLCTMTTVCHGVLCHLGTGSFPGGLSLNGFELKYISLISHFISHDETKVDDDIYNSDKQSLTKTVPSDQIHSPTLLQPSDVTSSLLFFLVCLLLFLFAVYAGIKRIIVVIRAQWPERCIRL